MGDDYIEISRSTNILGKSPFVFHEAFLFHTVSWDLWTEHFAPGELNLDRLFEVCKMEPRWRRNAGLLSPLYSRSRTNVP
ncbi:hypothetical protein ASPWEDRAFT_36353 [Aspergillus wentii DTO 134E9]|uniref:Uncharacterized protein n=1 Tax=Aspergillus wentii DTO 134E9 TaxID=1073089 RepID=A0A1L9RUR2_ASPWE|nr:uncharacterized protein ASPWEDRAFT_36353 [Aspergillus wentii DTO 134E9]OJJ38662.1 hypothetical protein ASPWEDRAFT_36353 [Aspergillus wentii DTO 134E9]